jgi:hypothetical protein
VTTAESRTLVFLLLYAEQAKLVEERHQGSQRTDVPTPEPLHDQDGDEQKQEGKQFYVESNVQRRKRPSEKQCTCNLRQRDEQEGHWTYEAIRRLAADAERKFISLSLKPAEDVTAENTRYERDRDKQYDIFHAA